MKIGCRVEYNEELDAFSGGDGSASDPASPPHLMQPLHAEGVACGEACDREGAQGHSEVEHLDETTAVHVEVLRVRGADPRPQVLVIQRILHTSG